ncbi:hypothetical protein MADA3029_710017 [Vibrio nigripulchritudo MADA3029]|nr:hypothetical protein VIBNIMADA3020_220017 [Vibrio nigripulchritudo MADA3020]CCN52849.1 hypothetical protein VIBNIMADA3021_160016 [Vibrio nigripulchritudo MADA3021]CCN61081.1 hypothetical protein MADA3029_710017 [Vibrio nigripulchritudo MADA3029]
MNLAVGLSPRKASIQVSNPVLIETQSYRERSALGWTGEHVRKIECLLPDPVRKK